MKYLKAALPTNAIICFTSKVSLIIPLAERQGLPRQCDRNTVLVREGFEGEYELTDFPSLLFFLMSFWKRDEGELYFDWYIFQGQYGINVLQFTQLTNWLSFVVILPRSFNKNYILISKRAWYFINLFMLLFYFLWELCPSFGGLAYRFTFGQL